MTTNHKKYHTLDFNVISNRPVGGGMNMLVIKTDRCLPYIHPGQFINILVPTHEVLLRRPISICDASPNEGKITILVKNLGRGSAAICRAAEGSQLNVLLPLGNGFTIPENHQNGILLVGGGVGMAPLYHLARRMHELGNNPTVLIGARTLADIPLKNDFMNLGPLFMTTENGSPGTTEGLVTDHELLHLESGSEIRRIYCCGPEPMMKAVAKIAHEKRIWCEVSLENKMACGVGACLCCVEKTVAGHKCTCTDGPVFNIESLTW